ncbi:hypothetical protein Tco_0190411 [Tanacetum coccineum]
MGDDINGDLGNFLKDNDLFPDFESQDIISLSPPGSTGLNENSNGTFYNADDSMSIGLDDLFKMDDIWDELDPGVLTNEVTISPVISGEDKSKGIQKPYQKIKGLYIGCLDLGEEYNQKGFQQLGGKFRDRLDLLWFHWISFDCRVMLGFGNIADDLDHVNHVITLPIEHRISRELFQRGLIICIVTMSTTCYLFDIQYLETQAIARDHEVLKKRLEQQKGDCVKLCEFKIEEFGSCYSIEKP